MATNQLQSIFPDIPRESPVIDKNGDFTALWSLGFGALFQSLQQNFKNEGIVFPPFSTANADQIQALYAPYIGQTYNELTMALPDISGQTTYNPDTCFTNQFVIATDGSPSEIVILAKWVPLAVMISGAGDPNGSVSGVLNWQYLDTTGPTLYVCTASGDDATATWTTV